MSDPNDISTNSDVPAPSSDASDISTAPPPSNDSTSAPSSNAPDDTSPPSGDSRQSDHEGLLAVVKKVVETRPEKPAVPSSSEEGDAETGAPGQASQDQAAATGEGTPPPEPATTQEADPSEAELKKLRPETRRRFERLLAQRNEARQALQGLEPEIQQHRQLQGYLQQHQLAPEDVNVLLGVGASLRRGDYQAFLEGVTPYVLAAQEVLGIRISPDLQQQVDEGMIDDATARNMTQLRHRAAQAEARVRENDQVATTQQQVEQTNQIRSAVDAWEAGIQQRDPDYAQMSGAVRRCAQGLMQERGIPRTSQEAVALTQAAYDEARAMYARAQPAPRATRPSPSSIHVATGSSSSAAPRSMKEAAVMALQNMRRAS